MATTLLGHIEPFDPDTDDWLQYVERMEQMFIANDLVGAEKAEKRRSIFLSGRETYLRHSEEPPLTGPTRHEDFRRVDSRTHETFQPPSIRSNPAIPILQPSKTARRVGVGFRSGVAGTHRILQLWRQSGQGAERPHRRGD